MLTVSCADTSSDPDTGSSSTEAGLQTEDESWDEGHGDEDDGGGDDGDDEGSDGLLCHEIDLPELPLDAPGCEEFSSASVHPLPVANTHAPTALWVKSTGQLWLVDRLEDENSPRMVRAFAANGEAQWTWTPAENEPALLGGERWVTHHDGSISLLVPDEGTIFVQRFAADGEGLNNFSIDLLPISGTTRLRQAAALPGLGLALIVGPETSDLVGSVVGVSSLGNLVWHREFAVRGPENSSLVSHADGVAWIEYLRFKQNTELGFRVINVDAEGETNWERDIVLFEGEEPGAVIVELAVTAEGEFFVFGDAKNRCDRTWNVALDVEGEIIWSKIDIGGPGSGLKVVASAPGEFAWFASDAWQVKDPVRPEQYREGTLWRTFGSEGRILRECTLPSTLRRKLHEVLMHDRGIDLLAFSLISGRLSIVRLHAPGSNPSEATL